MVSSHLLDYLSEKAHVILLVPSRLVDSVRDRLDGDVVVEPMEYQFKDYEGIPESPSRMVSLIRSVLGTSFTLVYGNLDVKPNVTHDLHVRKFREKIAEQKGTRKLTRLAAFHLSRLAVRSRLVRRGMQVLYGLVSRNRIHRDVFERHQPDLSVVCSLGLGADGPFLCESRAYGVPSLCVVQSWDKTSSKGYPPITPDSLVVWNYEMEEEAVHYCDIPRDRISVQGAPVWDSYFKDAPPLSRAELSKVIGIDLGAFKQLIFCALNSPGYHMGNLELIDTLGDALGQGLFGPSTAVLFRTHPNYGDHLERREELEQRFQNAQLSGRAAFQHPSLEIMDGYFLFRPDDDVILRSIFEHSDVCLSVGSTQMIEAAIFDKPAICIEYGVWESRTLKVDFSNYKLEHRERVFRCNATARSSSPSQLIKDIQVALKGRPDLADARRRIVDQELPLNRGSSAFSIAQHIAEVAVAGHSET